MTSAYRYADAEVNPLSYAPNKDDAGKYLPDSSSLEMILLAKIDRFGVMAVMGRPVLSFGELRRLGMAENIVAAYRSRHKSDNWTAWTEQHPIMAKILFDIEKDLS